VITIIFLLVEDTALHALTLSDGEILQNKEGQYLAGIEEIKRVGLIV
jgi:hypothetical protein